MALPTNNGLQGVLVAAITPRSKTGDLDFGATFELIDYLCAARVSGIALFTPWGEYPALEVNDRACLTYLAVKRSRVPVVASVGSATLEHSAELAREARSAGAAAILLPPPLYYRYEEAELLEFYGQFAEQVGSGTPMLISGDMPAQTASRLLESGRYAGIVDETGAGESLEAGVLFRADDQRFARTRAGGVGVLSAAACAAPELAMALNAAIPVGDQAKVARLEQMFQELVCWMERFPIPVGVKTAVAVRGISTGPLSVPLSPGKQRCLTQFREWFQGWLPASRKLAAHG